MDDRQRKYLYDIYSSILEIEEASKGRIMTFQMFMDDFVYRRFVERNLEIMGEAMNRILKINPDIPITSSRQIVGTRNMVIHAYDSLLPEIIWNIVINHLSLLKSEVEQLLNFSK